MTYFKPFRWATSLVTASAPSSSSVKRSVKPAVSSPLVATSPLCRKRMKRKAYRGPPQGHLCHFSKLTRGERKEKKKEGKKKKNPQQPNTTEQAVYHCSK